MACHAQHETCAMRLYRADDLTLVAMRKPGARFTWDDVHWKEGPDYHNVPQCVAAPKPHAVPPSPHTHASAMIDGRCCVFTWDFFRLLVVCTHQCSEGVNCRVHLLDHLSNDRRFWEDMEGRCAKTLLLGRTLIMRFCTGRCLLLPRPARSTNSCTCPCKQLNETTFIVPLPSLSRCSGILLT